MLQRCLSAVSAAGQVSAEWCSLLLAYLLQPPTRALAWWVFSPEIEQELQDSVKAATLRKRRVNMDMPCVENTVLGLDFFLFTVYSLVWKKCSVGGVDAHHLGNCESSSVPEDPSESK